MRRSTGVKWRLKFQWQSGRNPPELSPHMRCNLADISRLLREAFFFFFIREMNVFAWFLVALKSIASLFLISCIQTIQAYFTHLKARNRGDYVSIYCLHGYFTPTVLPPHFSPGPTTFSEKNEDA